MHWNIGANRPISLQIIKIQSRQPSRNWKREFRGVKVNRLRIGIVICWVRSGWGRQGVLGRAMEIDTIFLKRRLELFQTSMMSSTSQSPRDLLKKIIIYRWKESTFETEVARESASEIWYLLRRTPTRKPAESNLVEVFTTPNRTKIRESSRTKVDFWICSQVQRYLMKKITGLRALFNTGSVDLDMCLYRLTCPSTSTPKKTPHAPRVPSWTGLTGIWCIPHKQLLGIKCLRMDFKARESRNRMQLAWKCRQIIWKRPRIMK